MAAPEVEQGVHYRKIDSGLSAEKTKEILSALKEPGILDALKREPIRLISIGRFGDKQHPGWYDSNAKSVSVDSARKLGVQFGGEFQSGRTWNMSRATSDKAESMRRSLLQETAHHIESSIPGVKQVIAEAWGNPSRRPITGYAGYEPGEYFAESFVAYMAERDALAKYDAIGSKMVEQAIVLMRKPK